MKKNLLTLVFGAAALVAMPLHADVINIANAGFESGTAPAVGAPDWTITSGGTDWFTAAAGVGGSSTIDPIAAAEGTNWLSGNRLVTGAGSSSNPQTIVQLIDISSDAALIDGGTGFLDIGFMFSDSDPADSATVNVSFFSDVAGTTSVGTALTSGILDPTAEDGEAEAPWAARSVSGFVPVSARSLQLELVIERSSGSAGNAHFDDFSGSISAVPEPGSLAVVGLMTLGLVLRRRK